MNSQSYVPLPDPGPDGGLVTVAPFQTCQVECPASLAIEGMKGYLGAGSWRQLITHQSSDTALWFDLGVSHDTTAYPPKTQAVHHKHFGLRPGKNSPIDDMKTVGVEPSRVKYLIASHAHWDHMFPAGRYFPQAKLLCGAGTLEFAGSTWPTVEDSSFDGRIWDQTNSEIPVEEIPSPAADPARWTRIGPFANGYDFFGDQSFWIIDAPGHCRGNLAALARTRTKSGELRWVLMGGDCFHCYWFVHYPHAPFGKGVRVTSTDSFHENEEEAREFIVQVAKLKEVEKDKVLVWLAHGETLEGDWQLRSFLDRS